MLTVKLPWQLSRIRVQQSHGPCVSVSSYFGKSSCLQHNPTTRESVFKENIIADAGSRFKQVADWCLNTSVTSKIFALFGVPDVDLMATNLSRKVPVFYSWTQGDIEAWGIDPLAPDVNWKQWSLPYCFPPFPLLPQVLAKVRDQQVDKMILIVPWWPTKPFFPLLIDMILDVKRIQMMNKLVIDLTTGLPPQEVKRLKLAVCLVSGTSVQRTQIFLSRPGTSSHHHGGLVLNTGMVNSGVGGVSGPLTTPYHQLRHL